MDWEAGVPHLFNYLKCCQLLGPFSCLFLWSIFVEKLPNLVFFRIQAGIGPGTKISNRKQEASVDCEAGVQYIHERFQESLNAVPKKEKNDLARVHNGPLSPLFGQNTRLGSSILRNNTYFHNAQ